MCAPGGAGRREATPVSGGRTRGQRRRRGVLLLLFFALISAVGGCRIANPYEDARIEAEVKARLVAEKAANLTRLGVLSSNGIVYLSGTVESSDQRARAEALAGGVRGVRRVVNTLEVRPAPE